MRAIEILEANHRRGGGRFARQPERTGEAFELMRELDKRLAPQARKAWRWRILYLRAVIDEELRKTGGRSRGPVLKEAYDGLIRIYHAEHVHTGDDPLSGHLFVVRSRRGDTQFQSMLSAWVERLRQTSGCWPGTAGWECRVQNQRCLGSLLVFWRAKRCCGRVCSVVVAGMRRAGVR